MPFLRQSTASQEIKLGAFLDSTDGNTQETGLTIANTDIKLTKGGATTEVNKNSGGATHVASGRYSAVLDATDSNTLGILEVDVHVAGALAVHRTYDVITASAYDALFTGTFNNLGGTAQTADHTAGIAAIPTTDNTTAIADIPTTAEFELRTVTSATYATATNLADVPTVAEFNARTLLAGDYFDPAADAVANVTTVATTTTNTDMRGTDGANTTTPPTTAQIWAETTRVLTSGLNIVLAKGTGVTGFNDITAASVLAAGDIDGFSLEEAQKLTLSMGVGVLSGAATSTITIQAADGSKARITATVDVDGNRSAVIKDVTG